MEAKTARIVTKYAKMWPRELFDFSRPGELKKDLKDPGVYILYRDDTPYYIRKTKNSLFRRIRRHAAVPEDRYFNFWNFFSALVVPDPHHVDEVEAILITAMSTENRAEPKLERLKLPEKLGRLLLDARRDRVEALVRPANGREPA